MTLAHPPYGDMYTHQPHVNGIRAREAGFTLIEVAVVGAIIAIGTAIAVPTYLRWVPSYQLSQTTSALASSVNYARVAARTRNTTMTLGLAFASGKWSIQYGGGLLPDETLPANVCGGPAPCSTGSPAATVGFTPRGLSTAAANTTLQLSNTMGATYSVTVTPGGRVMMCKKATCP
jgi:prepilin-type N-terminal cleavage/methylation domain-containing protein